LLSTEVIHLSYKDTIDTACELVRQAPPGTQIWLIIPWRARLGRSLVNMKRLRAAAESAAVDLRLVSSHLQTRALAREAGIPIYLRLPSKLRRYTKLHRPVSQREIISIEETLPPQLRRRPRFPGIGAFILSLALALFLVGVLFGALLLLLPSAKVKLAPQAQTFSVQFDVVANPTYKEIDYGQAIIPARVVQVIIEGHGETPATGRMDVPEGHASGEVVFANKTTEPVTIPKGTIVRTSSGVTVRFYTVADVELPPELYAHARVGIIALEPGPQGNVKAFTINVVEGDVAQSVDVINDAPTKGGTIKRIPIVSYKDFDKLRAELIAQLQKQAYEQLVAELDEGEFIPPESLDVQVMSQHYDQVVDQQSDVLSMNMKIVARGVAIDGKALDQLAIRFLESKAGGELHVIPDSLRVVRSEKVEVEGKIIHFSAHATGSLAPTIQIQQVKRGIQGKKISEASRWLRTHYPLRQPPSIVVLPPWWGRLPFLPARIEVTISAEVS